MSVIEVRVQLESALCLGDGVVISSGENEIKSRVRANYHRKRIQFFGAPGGSDGFARPILKGQHDPHPMMRSRIVWFEFDGSAKFSLRGGLVPTIGAEVQTERRMRFGN